MTAPVSMENTPFKQRDKLFSALGDRRLKGLPSNVTKWDRCIAGSRGTMGPPRRTHHRSTTKAPRRHHGQTKVPWIHHGSLCNHHGPTMEAPLTHHGTMEPPWIHNGSAMGILRNPPRGHHGSTMDPLRIHNGLKTETLQTHHASTMGDITSAPWTHNVGTLNTPRTHHASVVSAWWLPWYFRGAVMVPPWCFSGGSRGVQRWVYGDPTVGPWCFRGVPIVPSVVSPWDFHGVAMLLPYVPVVPSMMLP